MSHDPEWRWMLCCIARPPSPHALPNLPPFATSYHWQEV